MKRRWVDDDLVEVGLDEAGRGSLWGRLYVGAVILSPEDEAYFDNGTALRQIKDSKKLTRRLRAILDDYIRETAIETEEREPGDNGDRREGWQGILRYYEPFTLESSSQ